MTIWWLSVIAGMESSTLENMVLDTFIIVRWQYVAERWTKLWFNRAHFGFQDGRLQDCFFLFSRLSWSNITMWQNACFWMDVCDSVENPVFNHQKKWLLGKSCSFGEQPFQMYCSWPLVMVYMRWMISFSQKL